MNAVLNTLLDHEVLSREEAKQAIIDIATGANHPAQVSAFITVFLMRPVAAEELGGFREGLLELCHPVDLSEYDPMDICGTGGDGKNTFNISTLSAFVAAGAGVKVAKHGNNSVSSACGSSNVLEYFGYRFSSSQEKLKADLEKAGICFLHAPLFHPALKALAEIRRALKVKTFFNMLGPLIHPASPSRQLSGVYSMQLVDHYKSILGAAGKDFSIVYSLDGYDEISLTGAFRIATNNSDTIFQPVDAGFKRIDPEAIAGGNTIDESAAVFERILNGNGTEEQNSVVIANAAAAIHCCRPQLSLGDAAEMAKGSLESKQALKTFKTLLHL
jgi:anthranilate phosphoribosyltransferase